MFVKNNLFWVFFFLLAWVFELVGDRATMEKRVLFAMRCDLCAVCGFLDGVGVWYVVFSVWWAVRGLPYVLRAL